MPKCVQCGVDKPQDEFRKYGNQRGHYRYCMACQTLLGRYRYLVGKPTLTEKQSEELATLRSLYEKRRAKGLQAPGADGKLLARSRRPGGVEDLLVEAMRLVDTQD